LARPKKILSISIWADASTAFPRNSSESISPYRVLCIDSLSHFWIGKGGELDIVDRAARRMQNPNSFAAWKQVTPLHNALIDKIISAPLHILASMRAKTEWILDKDERTGKTVPRKVGPSAPDRETKAWKCDATPPVT